MQLLNKTFKKIFNKKIEKQIFFLYTLFDKKIDIKSDKIILDP